MSIERGKITAWYITEHHTYVYLDKQIFPLTLELAGRPFVSRKTIGRHAALHLNAGGGVERLELEG